LGEEESLSITESRFQCLFIEAIGFPAAMPQATNEIAPLALPI
jgi:hypothetical protein